MISECYTVVNVTVTYRNPLDETIALRIYIYIYIVSNLVWQNWRLYSFSIRGTKSGSNAYGRGRRCILGYILSQKPRCWRVILRGSDETSPRRNYQPHRIEEPHHTGNIAVAPQVPSLVRFPIKLHEATDSLSCLKLTFWYNTRGAAVPLQTFPHYSKTLSSFFLWQLSRTYARKTQQTLSWGKLEPQNLQQHNVLRTSSLPPSHKAIQPLYNNFHIIL